ncbi:MAG TPA: hypothetical protein VJH68_04560 [Candidatus Nanoarchaeia archaeon]|nr:hypothetical protein [Candidatus Nanoarchaeia archaeon]
MNRFNQINRFNLNKFNLSKFSLNKKGAGPVESWIDYLLLFIIALFSFIFLFSSLSLSLIFRDNAAVNSAASLQAAENLINLQKGAFADQESVDTVKLKKDVDYLIAYKLSKPADVEEIGFYND